jgi:DNA-binding response OmpR family regulator
MPERLVPSISLLSATVQNDRVTAARILVVEDSNAIRVPVATALSAQGFELASAADGSELERLLPSFAPDLVILQRCGESLDLTDTERRPLGYLAAHRDRVVSKTQILTAVWGYDGFDQNLVEVHVSSLRRKLEAGGRSRLVHTVRGSGYLLGMTT